MTLRRSLQDRCKGKFWDPFEAPVARALLEQPWCWPQDAALQNAARSLGASRRATTPGEVCMVAVNQEHNEGMVWRLVPDAGPGTTPFSGEAARCLQQVFWLTARDLPALQRLDLLRSSVSWGALALHESERDTLLLDGPSFGLAMCLGVASLLLQLPVDPSWCASATVSATGELGCVEGLPQKIKALHDHAPGVSKLLVAASQKEEADQLIRSKGLEGLEARGVGKLSEVFSLVFPEHKVQHALARAWENPAVAASASQDWFRTALESSPRLLDWRAFASTTDILFRLLGPSAAPGLTTRVWLARQISRRHAGEHSPIPWAQGEPSGEEAVSDVFLAQLRRPVRLDVLAHMVQASADADDEVATVVPRARQCVAERQERSVGDIKLLGACGRALASVGRYKEAIELLREATEDWFAIEQGHQSTHALSEYLRLLGLCQEKDELNKALELYLPRLGADSRLHQGAFCYVRLSAGRALVQVEKHAEALDQLCDGVDILWERTPDDVQRTRLRWLARACDGVKKPEEAARCRGRLKTASPGHIQQLLSQLDEALEGGHPEKIEEARCFLSASVANHKTWSTEVERLQRVGADARRLAEEYRY